MIPTPLAVDAGNGLWCIEPRAFDRLDALLRGVDVAAVAAARAAPARRPGVVRGDIAVIDVAGPLTKRCGVVQAIFGNSSTEEIREAVIDAGCQPGVAGVMLRVESPGGQVSGIAELAKAVSDVAVLKPVHTFIEDIGASAGYWIASQAARVSANPMALVGSIGTFTVAVDWSEAAAKIGAKVHLLASGIHKGAGTLGTRIEAAHLEHWQSIVTSINGHFLDAVAAGRGMTRATVERLADGRAHVAAQAKQLRLIDAVSSFDEAMNALRAAIGAKARGGGVVGAGNAAPAADAVAEVTARVNKLTAGGMARPAAHAHVFRTDPALHRAWLQAMNPGRAIA